MSQAMITHAQNFEGNKIPIAREPQSHVSLPDPRNQPMIDPAKLPDRYAMICTGVCLEPTFKDGSSLIFDRTASWGVGDFVMIVFKPEHVPVGRLQCMVKQVVLAPPAKVTLPLKMHPDSNVVPTLICRQFNPPRSYSVELDQVMAIHKCLGPMPEVPRTRMSPEEQKEFEVDAPARPRRVRVARIKLDG